MDSYNAQIVTIKAVQELIKENKSLHDQLNKLAEENKSLKEEVDKINTSLKRQ